MMSKFLAQNERAEVAHTAHDDWYGHAKEVPLERDSLSDSNTGLNYLHSANTEIGLTTFETASADQNTGATQYKLIATNLQTALEKAEFVLHYQPKIKLDTGSIIGAEVLLRWNHPELGIVLPDQFLAVAEETGLIIPIGHWVLGQACSQMKQWLDDDLGPLTLSVNISATQLYEAGFVESIRKILQTTGLAPASLVLELKETAVMRDLEASILILQALKTLGVQLALDNYGGGGTSLKHLQRLPLDVIKVGRMYIEEIQSVSKGGFIVNAALYMAKNLHLKIIAEGIESHVQRAFLQAHECPEGQGYLFSPALPAKSFSALLVTGIMATFDYTANMVSSSEFNRPQASWLSR